MATYLLIGSYHKDPSKRACMMLVDSDNDVTDDPLEKGKKIAGDVVCFIACYQTATDVVVPDDCKRVASTTAKNSTNACRSLH